MRINHPICDSDESPEGAVERSITQTATGDEHRGDGRRCAECQGGLIAQLVQRLRDVRGPDDVLASGLGLAELEYHRAARTTEVRRISGYQPVDIEQAGQSAD